MGIEASVTNQQITASVGETQIDATVSGGVGPTGPSGVVTVSAPLVNSGTSSAASLSLAIGTGLEVSGGQLRLPASGVVAGSYSTVTVDATGRVTAGSTHAVSWDDVSGKPSTFTPSAHAASHGAGGDDELEVEGGQVRIASDAENASSLAEGSIAATFLHTANANGVPAALPIATANARGAVRIGSGVSVDGNGVISVSTNYAASSHTHGNITNAGAIGTTSGLPIITTASGVLTTGAFGTSAGQFAAGNHTHTGADVSFTAFDTTFTAPANGNIASFLWGIQAGDDGHIVSNFLQPSLENNYAALSHTHSAADVTSGTLDIARIPTGTSSTTVALGNHTHSQLHDRSHAITSTSDHTATAWRVFYSNGSGEVSELVLGAANTVLQSNGASAAPTFGTVQKTITSGTAAPTGGSDGDIYLQYTA